MSIEKVLYTATATSTGGREGHTRSDDGVLDLQLSMPRSLGGSGGPGTNPEQLFAAGYAACFLSSMELVAERMRLALPAATSVTSHVGIGPIKDHYGIQVALSVSAPGLDHDQLQKLVERAHRVCPYSNATRGNIDVSLSIAD